MFFNSNEPYVHTRRKVPYEIDFQQAFVFMQKGGVIKKVNEQEDM